MISQSGKTATDIFGNVSWGTHLCQFYRSKEDLIEMLVPYFVAGLSNSEFCTWVTSEPLAEEEARRVMTEAIPDFARYLRSGQIEIMPYERWYLKEGVFDSERMPAGWVDKLNQALARGYKGMRLAGNTSWLGKDTWKAYTDCEAAVNSAIGELKMLALCTYSLDKCNAAEAIDVVRNHHLALVKREGGWEFIETAGYKKTREALFTGEERLHNYERLATIGKAAGSISHELRNPLATIDSSVYYIAKQLRGTTEHMPVDVEARIATHLERIHDAVRDSTAIIQSLLDLARAGEQHLSKLDLCAFTDTIIESSKVPSTVTVLREFPEREVVIEGDEQQLRMAFSNIIKNAVQAMEEEGTITVAIVCNHENAQVCFADTGPGIPEENMGRIFEPLFTTKAGGTGFGLAIARMVAERHGGTISAMSGSEKGAIFSISLPLSTTEAEEG
ncbi:MAG: MEDS domain-containing protein [Chloroflexi bacterium]|nr:MEDS domain-containing protein [Chloroflexota bacterium]